MTESLEDGFYLNYTEIFDFIDGKAESLSLGKLAKIRKEEFDVYMNENDPPDRFITHGAVGVSLQRKDILDSGDLLKNKIKISDDPNLIYGVSCCPGVVKEGSICDKIDDAKNLNGEILVTKELIQDGFHYFLIVEELLWKEEASYRTLLLLQESLGFQQLLECLVV